MKRALSILVFGLCCIAAVSLLCITIATLPQIIHALTIDSEGWGVWFFQMIAPLMAAGTLLLGVIPSALLYRKDRQRLDRISLCISSILLGLVVLAWIAAEPLRHWVIFGRHWVSEP